MAYTYDTFLNAAKSTGMYDAFGQEDLIIAQKSPEYGLSLLKLQQDAGKATTEEQKLLVQEAINQLRETYGAQIPSETMSTAGSFAYDYQDAYQKLLDEASNPDSFDYDHRLDTGYSELKDSWIADGNATREKILSAPSASQGVQSSWADTAAQQGNNYYDTKLNDQIPTLQQNAYEEYLNDNAVKQSQVGALATDRDFDYTVHNNQIQMEQAAAQQKFDNALTLNAEFGTDAPSMPDLTGLLSGKYKDPNVIGQAISAKAAENGYSIDAEAAGNFMAGLMARMNKSYSYSQENAYQEALDKVINQEDFSYTHGEDPLYDALRKTYLREGDRTMADTLAELNAATGGVANSYSIRAATDAGNAYNESLNAAIPGLRQNAYQKYLGDFETKLQGLDLLAQDRAFDYEKWLQEYQLQETAKQQEFNNALELYEQIGLTPEIAAILGVPYEEPSSSSGGGGTPRENLDSYTVANKTGDGWIQVGGGRITDDSLQKKVASGEIIATSDSKTKTITYTYASKK